MSSGGAAAGGPWCSGSVSSCSSKSSSPVWLGISFMVRRCAGSAGSSTAAIGGMLSVFGRAVSGRLVEDLAVVEAHRGQAPPPHAAGVERDPLGQLLRVAMRGPVAEQDGGVARAALRRVVPGDGTLGRVGGCAAELERVAVLVEHAQGGHDRRGVTAPLEGLLLGGPSGPAG